MKLYIILLITCFTIFSCNIFDTANQTANSGNEYTYQSFNTSGTLIVQGWFKYEMQDSLGITGNWNFVKFGDPKNIGPQTGAGQLVGEKNDSTIWIELNPKFADNNVELWGKIDGDKILGTWQWSTFAGVSNWGTFRAFQN